MLASGGCDDPRGGPHDSLIAVKLTHAQNARRTCGDRLLDVELPQNVKALLGRAVQAQLREDGAQADAAYHQFVEAALATKAPLYDLGVLMRNFGRLSEARTLLEAEQARRPDHLETGYELGLTLLGQGDYPAGWPLYERRRAIPQFHIHSPVLPFPEWRGEPVEGKRIVLFPEQGLGDSIMFARFALTLRDRGAQVLLLCRPALERLLRHSLDGVEVIAAHGTVDMGEPDFWAHFGSLPGPLGLTVDAIPSAPYLAAPTSAAKANQGRGALRIGLATRGNPAHPNDARRTLSAADAVRLAALPGVVVSLHPEDSGARDFADTAALMAGLDLVVSVDTSIAHLAGALGKRAFVLTPGFGTDWRWMQGRDDSPWYPSLTLFRGRADGGWGDALDRLDVAVSSLAAPVPA